MPWFNSLLAGASVRFFPKETQQQPGIDSMVERLQTGEKSKIKHLQESARWSGYFLPDFFIYLYPQEP